MKNDEEKRKLDKILESFSDMGVPEHLISLDMISAKILQLVKLAIVKMMMSLAAKRKAKLIQKDVININVIGLYSI